MEEYYGKLQTWGVALTRGDRVMAQEIVHDLCLHFTVAKPDLSQVTNLDGYLYTSLRHIYLSALARASREAMQTVNIADFDSVQFALGSRRSDNLVDMQNDLRRICNYVLWRKSSSKSASYFILHFFHGYARREVAEIARSSIAAIYNKLKVARTELTSQLEASGKLRIATRDLPPNPLLRVSAISSAELFQELRQRIFGATSSDCLPEEHLLVQYRTTVPKPIPCGLLSHIVSCEHCLALLDRHFQRTSGQDQEPPGSPWSFKDGDGNRPGTPRDIGYHEMMSLVRRQRDRIYEHRPRTLSIAVNGRIVAFHDVQSERSTLVSRADHPEAVQFVEVFTDQQIRLALLPIADLPPEGLQVHRQKVLLSDDRSLELRVSFDGQGLHSQVTYLDPALAAETTEEETEEKPIANDTVPLFASLPATRARGKFESIASWIVRSIHAAIPRYALAWATILIAVLSGAGYLTYRYTLAPLDARTILKDSVKLETASAKGKAEHRILQLEALDAGGRTAWKGTVDVWQEPANGRTMRRLYNAQHQLLAAEWHRKNGESGSHIASASGLVSEADHDVAQSKFWEVGVSAHTFQALAARHLAIRTSGSNYELTGTDLARGRAHIVSAALVLDHHLHFVGETLHVRNGYGFTEVRFVEAYDVRVPAVSVPDSVFEPGNLNSGLRKNPGDTSVQNGITDRLGGDNTKLVQTEVAVLYRLSELGADVGEPIQITRTPSGHILVAGTVASDAVKSKIVASLDTVPDRQLLEVRLTTQGSLRALTPASRPVAPATSVYNVARAAPPADAILRKYFADKGLSGKQIDSSVALFSRDALDHAQRALQHAYALDRLGSSFSAEELRTMGPVAQQQWSEMVARHSTALRTQLDELQQQIAQVVPAVSLSPLTRPISSINSPPDFAGWARRLLVDTQKLNGEAGGTFSSGLTATGIRNSKSSLETVLQSIPLSRAEELAEFGARLTNGKHEANTSVEHYPQLPR
ncbi:MAG: RNA polymerase sigma factor [Acidobacteriota bacterium]